MNESNELLSNHILNDLQRDTTQMQQLIQQLINDRQPYMAAHTIRYPFYRYIQEIRYHISLLEQRTRVLEQAIDVEQQQSMKSKPKGE